MASGGASAITHRAVAKEAGIAVASVSYHFASVDELRRAVFAWAGEAVIERLNDEVDAPAGTDIRDAVAEFAAELATTHRLLAIALLQAPTLTGDVEGDRVLALRLNERLSAVYAGLFGSEVRGSEVSAATLGILYVALATGQTSPDWVRGSVRSLLETYGAHRP